MVQSSSSYHPGDGRLEHLVETTAKLFSKLKVGIHVSDKSKELNATSLHTS